MSEATHRDETLLTVEEVAERLGVQPTTVYRWCREGQLACLKPGKSWRIRHTSLDAFLRQGERPRTLLDHLRAFAGVPDHLVVLAQDEVLLQRLDATFFRLGEEHGALLVKFFGGETISRETLREGLRHNGLDLGKADFLGVR